MPPNERGRPSADLSRTAAADDSTAREYGGLIDWAEDALDAIASGDLPRARRDVSALRGWLLAKAGLVR